MPKDHNVFNNGYCELNKYKSDNQTTMPEWVNSYNDEESKETIEINKRIYKVIFDKSFKNCHPTICSYWFYYMENLETIEGIEYLNTDKVTYMDGMFAGCSKLKTVDLSNFKMDNVTNVGSMFDFGSRERHISVKIGDFNLKNATSHSFFLNENNKNHVTFYTTPDKYTSNKANDKYNLISDNLHVYIPASTTATAKYGTFCLPYGSDLTDGEFSGFDNIYTATSTSEDSKGVVLTKADKIEPGVAYVFRRNQTDNDVYANAITFKPNSDNEATEPNNDGRLLQGTFTKTTAPVDSYVLQSDGKFHIVGSTKTINVAPYKAYLQLPSAQSASTLSIVFDGGTTSINGISDNNDNNDAPVYDLSGRRIDTMVKGNIYVKNGKKFMF